MESKKTLKDLLVSVILCDFFQKILHSECKMIGFCEILRRYTRISALVQTEELRATENEENEFSKQFNEFTQRRTDETFTKEIHQRCSYYK